MLGHLLQATSQQVSKAPIRNEDILTSLPQEILQKIWGYLSPSDLHAVSCLNKRMQSSVVVAVNAVEPKLIKNFMEGLIERIDLDLMLLEGPDLPLFVEVKTDLQAIADSISILDTEGFANLLVMKKYILNIQNRVMQSIKKLPDIRLILNSSPMDKSVNVKRYLYSHGLHTPHLMERMGELIRIQYKMDALIGSDLMRVVETASIELRELLQGICREGFFDMGISLVDSTLASGGSPFLINWMIKDICNAYVKKGCFSKAMDIAEFISYEVQKDFTLRRIKASALTQEGHKEKA